MLIYETFISNKQMLNVLIINELQEIKRTVVKSTEC